MGESLTDQPPATTCKPNKEYAFFLCDRRSPVSRLMYLEDALQLTSTLVPPFHAVSNLIINHVIVFPCLCTEGQGVPEQSNGAKCKVPQME